MVYEVNYIAGERQGCSSKLSIEDRIFYVKLFASSANSAKYFSADQKGIVEKEISKTEFELWLNILTDKEAEVKDILGKIILGKKY
jgi:hypothetical protein